METNPKKQRQHFYRDYASGQWSMSELCARHRTAESKHQHTFPRLFHPAHSNKGEPPP